MGDLGDATGDSQGVAGLSTVVQLQNNRPHVSHSKSSRLLRGIGDGIYCGVSLTFGDGVHTCAAVFTTDPCCSRGDVTGDVSNGVAIDIVGTAF